MLAELFLEAAVLGRQLQLLGGLVEHDQEHIGIDRFFNEAERTELHGLYRLGHAAIASDHDDLRFRTGFLEIAKQIETIGIGQHEVHQHDFRPPGSENFPGLSRVRRSPGQVAPGFDQQFQKFSSVTFFIAY